MPVEALPTILLLGTIFGTTVIASRFVVGQLDPITYVALRLTLASVGYLLVYLFSFRGRKFPRGAKIWKHGLLMGILGNAVPMSTINFSLLYLSGGMASIMMTLSPAITVIFAHFFLSDERMTRRKVIGILIALSGALLLIAKGENGLPDVSETNPLGYILVLVGITVGATMMIYARKYTRDCDTFDLNSVRIIVAAVAVSLLSFFWVGFDFSAVTGQGVMALGWAAIVGTFFGMLIAFYNLQRFGATAAAMVTYVMPVVATLGGWLILDEEITSGMFVGMALIVGGIVVLNNRSKPVTPDCGLD